MAASEIRSKDYAEQAFTISFASIANGAGRSSAAVTNTSDMPSALVSAKIVSGSSAPTVGTTYTIRLLRDTGTIADDGWAGTDAAYTALNAPVLGTIVVTASSNTAFQTASLWTGPLGPLGPSWGIGVTNETGQTVSDASHAFYYVYCVDEAQ